MTAILMEAEYVDSNPLDLVEQVADLRNWVCERSHDQELNLALSGEWRDYHVSLNWRDDISGLHMACSLDLRVSPDKRGAVREVMGLVNEQLWSGHFDMWLEDGTVLFRDSLLLCGGATATPEQCETLLRLALEACERFFPAFQYVIWAGKEPREAVEACLFETHGTA